MKPMLASPAGKEIKFPVLASVKLDGIRCLIINGVACGRSLKPLPNKYVQELFGKQEFNGLDGELVVGDPASEDVFQRTQSEVMTVGGRPDVTFYVFDDFHESGSFNKRVHKAARRIKNVLNTQIVPHYQLLSQEELNAFENDTVRHGYEGVMLRDPTGHYKHGRSTTKEGLLLKVKRFKDGEAVIIGYSELMHNANEAKINELGQMARSSHKANKVGMLKVGSLIVKDLETSVEFEIGTGFTDEQRIEFWNKGKLLIGQIVKYKSQPSGVKDKPRFPVFLGLRNRVDMSC